MLGWGEINVSAKTKYKFQTNTRKIFIKKHRMDKLVGRENMAEWQRIFRL